MNNCTPGHNWQETKHTIGICAWAEDKEVLDTEAEIKAEIASKVVSHNICHFHKALILTLASEQLKNT